MVEQHEDIGEAYLSTEIAVLRCLNKVTEALDRYDPETAMFWMNAARAFNADLVVLMYEEEE